jgi:hypothetical protein
MKPTHKVGFVIRDADTVRFILPSGGDGFNGFGQGQPLRLPNMLSPLRKAFSGAYFSQNLIFQSSHTQVCCGFQISLLQKLFSIKYFRRGLY